MRLLDVLPPDNGERFFSQYWKAMKENPVRVQSMPVHFLHKQPTTDGFSNSNGPTSSAGGGKCGEKNANTNNKETRTVCFSLIYELLVAVWS